MAQFRTTADALDEVLLKAGEPTSGTSLYETSALTFLNKCHHTIIGGGSIFDVEVDEPWVWAKSRFPIVLELQPAYITGTITFVNGDINITFSTAPSVSVEGWHLQANGKSTVYKITQHTAAGLQAQLDSNFVDDSGVYNFRCFKLDYQIFPAFMQVDNFNDKVDFTETTTAALVASLTHGSYTPSNLIAHVVSKLGSVGTLSYGGSYDSVLRSFNVTATGTFAMYGASGANKRRSSLPLIGFDRLDQTAATTYTSTYTPNQIGRLIEPFKLFGYDGSQPFIYSSDPVKMQEEYPISVTSQRIPDRFVRLTEESDGTIWVRFNAYPRTVIKVACDWIPQPIDLQDNAASVPMLPRADVDTLINAAASYITFDKSDSKFEKLMALTAGGLEAMKKKNRSMLFRTGETFAQQVPREDLVHRRRAFNYGYTVSGGTNNTTAESTQSMIKVTLAYSSFQTTSLSKTVVARTLPANRSLQALIVKHSTAFAGVGIATLLLDVGIAGDPTRFINSFDVAQAVAAANQDSSLMLFFPAVATDIQVRLTATGANLNLLSQGSVDINFWEAVVS